MKTSIQNKQQLMAFDWIERFARILGTMSTEIFV